MNTSTNQPEMEKTERETEQGKDVSPRKRIFRWIIKNIKFFFVPMSRLEELTTRQFEYEKSKSKRNFIQRLKNPLTITGIIIIFVIVSFAIFAPWISPYSFEELNGLYTNDWEAPNALHWFGTGDFGRDILGRCIYGARSSLTIALPSIFLSVIVGTFIGIIAGYFGGWLDNLIMRITDVLLAFPPLIFAMVLVGTFGPKIEMIGSAVFSHVGRVIRLEGGIHLCIQHHRLERGVRTPPETAARRARSAPRSRD